MDEQNMINQAFEKYLGSSLSKKARQNIVDRYGEDIASKEDAVYSDAMKAPVDWRTASVDNALDTLHDMLNSKYPWLSTEARKNINYAFIMAWK